MPSNGVVLVEIAFGILGRIALRLSGKLEEKWGRPRERAILSTLLVYANRTVSIGTLLDWAWAGEKAPPKDPTSTLHTYATRLRGWLDQLTPRHELIAAQGGYRLNVDKSLIDYHQFRELIARAKVHLEGNDLMNARRDAEQALQLWRGVPLEGISSGPAESWRARVVRDEWLPANAALLEVLLAQGDFEDALVRLNELQTDHPDDITLVKLRMTTLHCLSRSAERTAYYINMRQRYRRDFDEQAAEHLRWHHDALTEATGDEDRTPVAPIDVVPRLLPQDVSSTFVGRRTLVDALDAAAFTGDQDLGASGVVIVDGMGGVGKTTLVIHWAHRIRARFPGGDFYLNLHGFSDHQQVSHASVVDDLLITLGYLPDRGHSARSKELLLSQLFADRRALVILDNARGTAQVQRLIPLLANCLIVVTSRQRLTTLSRVTGARRVRVDPMSATEGAELLAARLDPHHALNRVEQEHLATLCGGLPLFITMLGEYIGHRRSAELSTFVETVTVRDLLSDVAQDEEESGSATRIFMWSYQALEPAERRLFRLLALHPQTDFSAQTACAFDDRSPQATGKSLLVLVGAHLLEPRFDRYEFHDLVREFAVLCVEQDEPPRLRDEAESRMVRHFLASVTIAHRTLYPNQLTAPALPETSQDKGLTFDDAGHARDWFNRERGTLVAVAAHAARRGRHALAWRLADMAASILDRQGSYDHSKTMRALAVSSAGAAGEPEAEASSLAGLGMILIVRGEYAEARRCLHAALRFAEETDNVRGRGSVLHQLGRLELLSGDSAEAVTYFRRCLRVNQDSSDEEGLTWTYCRLGAALRRLDREEALVCLHQAQYHAERLDDATARATVLVETGRVYRDRGDLNRASTFCKHALEVVESSPIPDFAVTIDIYLALAEIASELPDKTPAPGYARRAVALSQQSNSLQVEARAWDALGQALFACGEAYEACIAWRRAVELLETVSPVRAAEIRANLRRLDAGEVSVPYGRTSSPEIRPVGADQSQAPDVVDD